MAVASSFLLRVLHHSSQDTQLYSGPTNISVTLFQTNFLAMTVIQL